MKHVNCAILANPTEKSCFDLSKLIVEKTKDFSEALEAYIASCVRLNADMRSLKTEEKEWLTSEEAAAFLGIPLRSLFNETSNGKLPYYKYGKRLRFKLDELRKSLLANPRGDRND